MDYYKTTDSIEAVAIQGILKEEDKEGTILIHDVATVHGGKDVPYAKYIPNDLGVPFVRAVVGAGPVYIDENVLMFLYFIESKTDPSPGIQQSIKNALISLGITSLKTENNDILCQKKKIVGIAGGMMYEGKWACGSFISLVVDWDKAEQCADFKKDIRERSMGLNQLGYNIKMPQLIEAVENNSYFPLDLKVMEQAKIDEIRKRIFDTEIWKLYAIHKEKGEV